MFRGPAAVPTARPTAHAIAEKLSAYAARAPGSWTVWMSTNCGPQRVPMSSRRPLVPPSWAARKRWTIAMLAWSASRQPAKRFGRSAAYA